MAHFQDYKDIQDRDGGGFDAQNDPDVGLHILVAPVMFIPILTRTTAHAAGSDHHVAAMSQMVLTIRKINDDSVGHVFRELGDTAGQ